VGYKHGKQFMGKNPYTAKAQHITQPTVVISTEPGYEKSFFLNTYQAGRYISTMKYGSPDFFAHGSITKHLKEIPTKKAGQREICIP
jgi:hypothetical protein